MKKAVLLPFKVKKNNPYFILYSKRSQSSAQRWHPSLMPE
jgi:hypothetical protein